MAFSDHERRKVQKVKVVLVGDMDVGKTCLALRFARSSYSDTQSSTIGASFLAKAVDLPDRTIVFHIWDTAGQERFHSIIPMFLRDAKAAILVYDITDQASFKSIKTLWMQKLRKDGPENLKIAIVGNKSDLTEERQVERNMGEEFAEWHRYLFIETSAKTGDNVNELFCDIAKRLSSVDDGLQTLVSSSRIRLEDQQSGQEVTRKRRKCCGSF